MTYRTPAPDQGALSAVRTMAYEQGRRDAARILADLELSSLPVTSGMPPRTAAATRPRATAIREPRRAGTRRSAAAPRRGQRIEARAARIAEQRTGRTGSLHEVVALPGGRYGVRKVTAQQPAKRRRARSACGS